MALYTPPSLAAQYGLDSADLFHVVMKDYERVKNLTGDLRVNFFDYTFNGERRRIHRSILHAIITQKGYDLSIVP